MLELGRLFAVIVHFSLLFYAQPLNILPVKDWIYCRWSPAWIYCRWRTYYIAGEALIILSVKDWIYCRWSRVYIAGEGLQNLDILGTYSLWAQRALYRATTVGSWDFGFFLSHSEGPTQFSHSLQQARRSEDLYSNPDPRGKHTLVYIYVYY